MTPHQILGVQPGASLDEIKKAYRARMMECHPDKGGDLEEAKAVNRAFEQLTKPQPEPVPVMRPQGVYVRVVYSYGFYGNFTGTASTTTSGGWF